MQRTNLSIIARRSVQPRNALHWVLILGLMLQSFAWMFVAESAEASVDDEVGLSYEGGLELLRSADPRNYLPAEANLPFTNDTAQSPFAFLDGVVASPFDMLPVQNATGETAPTGLGVLDTVRAVQDDLQGVASEQTFGGMLLGWLQGFNREWPPARAAVADGTRTQIDNALPNEAGHTTLYLPVVRHESNGSAPPPPENEPDDLIFTSPDGKVTLAIPLVNFDDVPEISYAPVTRDNLRGVDPTAREVQESVMMFAVEAQTGRDETIQFLKQEHAIFQINYTDNPTIDETKLSLYAYSNNSQEWYSLPTSVDAENNIAIVSSGSFSLFALSLSDTGADKDPCAVGVELIADEQYPFQPAPIDGDDDVIPQGVYHPESTHDFDNYTGTKVFLSGTDTGSLDPSDPYNATETETKDKVTIKTEKTRGDQQDPVDPGPLERDKEGKFQMPENDITDYVPQNHKEPISPAPDAAEAEVRVDQVKFKIELEHDDSTEYGSTGYYLIREDITDPVYLQVRTYHDGEGSVTIYVEAYDNCAVQGIIVEAMNTISGNLAPVPFTYLTGAEDGLGSYRAELYLGTVGKNFYNITLTDMAHYAPGNANHPVEKFLSEPATNQAGEGLAEFSNKCESECGCTAACGVIGDPVTTRTGNFVTVADDVMLPGPGDSALEMMRTYNSAASSRYHTFIGKADEPVDVFGIGWQSPFQYQVELFEKLPGFGAGVKVIYPDGHSARYEGTGGQLTPLTPGEVNTVTRNGTEIIVYDIHELATYRFQAPMQPTPSTPVVTAQLMEKTDANGNSITYGYGGFNGPTQISNSAGRTLTLGYQTVTDAKGVTHDLLTSITGPEGLNLTYTYDTTRLLLTSVNDNRGKVTNYAYDANYRLTNITTPKGHDWMALTYTDDNRVATQTIGSAETYTFDYNDAANTYTVTDSLGNAETHTYDANERLIQLEDGEGYVETYTYDANDYRKTLDDNNAQAYSYGYDANSNLTTTVGPEGFDIAYTYNAQNRPITFKDSEGRVTNFAYDGAGNLTQITNADGKPMTMTYNGNGQPVQIVDYNGNTIGMTYNAFGDLESLTNGEGETVTFAYDGLGRMTSMTTDEDHTFTFTYDVASELMTSTSGPLGYTLSYTYDDNGNLLTEKDARGNTTAYTYDTSENLETVTDPLSGTTTFGYDAMNNLTSMKDEEGRTTTYVYDEVYNLTEIQAPESRTTKFEYDGNKNITKIVDGEGRETILAYDGRDRLTTITDALSGVTTITYDKVDNITAISDANSHTTTYVYDVLNRLIRETDAENQVTTYSYDKNGNLLTVTDAETNVTTLTYDGADRLATITNAEDETVTFAYDSLGNIVDLTQPNGVKIHWAYDGLYRPITLIQNYQGSEAPVDVTYRFEYDLNGNLTKVTDPEGNASAFTYDPLNRLETDKNARNHTMTYGYDKVDNLTSVEDRRGNTTTLVYDDADRLVEVRNALSNSSFYTYDKVDNLLTYTDENGHTVTMTYDDLDRLDTVTNPETHAVDFDYDPVGNLLRFTDARGNPTIFEYDDVNRLITSTDALNGATNLTYDRVGNVTVVNDANGHETTIAYDDAYRTTIVTDAENYTTKFDYDKNGNVIEVIDGNDNPTTIAYDPLDRIKAVTNAENETTSYTYDLVGNLLDIRENDGIIKRYEYDPIYQLTGVTLNADGVGGAWEADVLYQYSYDENGNLETITDPRNLVTTFSYDVLNRVEREVNPIGDQWDYTYDAVGNLATRTDGNRETTNYAYYDDDQLRQIAYSDGDIVDFRYDENNNLTGMDDWLGTTAFAYDKLNRITSVDDALDRTLTYGYDAVGNVTTMEYPNGGAVEYSYLKNDWLNTMTDTADNDTVYTRNGVGQVTSAVRGNGATMTATYDKANRLTFMGHYESDGTPIQTTAYELDDIGLRESATVVYGRPWPRQTVETYEYDGLRRLTAVNGDYDFSSGGDSGLTAEFEFRADYGYDAAGNRVSWNVTDDQMTEDEVDPFVINYSYNAANQLLESVKMGGGATTTTTFAYDDNGNRINKTEKEAGHPYTYGTDYAYDRADRLTSVENYRINDSLNPDHRRNREETVMEYDGMGRRLVKTYIEHDGRGRIDQTEYTFDGLDIVAEYPVYEDGEFTGRNNHRNEVYLNDQREIVTQRRFPNGVGEQTYQYHTDGRRDVVSLSDESTRAWVHYDYDAYGQILPEWGNYEHPENRDHNHFTFSSELIDQNTKLQEYFSRAYQSSEGVWLSADSFRGFSELPQTMHRHGFVGGDPINHVDFYGFGFGDWAKDKWNKGKRKVAEKFDDAKEWVSDNKAAIVETVVSVGIGLTATAGCAALGVATLGAGAIACAAAFGAVGAGAGGLAGNIVGGRKWHDGLVTDLVVGGVSGGFAKWGGDKIGKHVFGKLGPKVGRPATKMMSKLFGKRAMKINLDKGIRYVLRKGARTFTSGATNYISGVVDGFMTQRHYNYDNYVCLQPRIEQSKSNSGGIQQFKNEFYKTFVEQDPNYVRRFMNSFR